MLKPAEVVPKSINNFKGHMTMKDSQFNSNFQNLLDHWAKAKFSRFKKHLKIAFLKSEKYGHKLLKHDWKQSADKVGKAYYANKALINNADSNLPYSTLVLLGQMLAHPLHNKEITKIIRENALKFNGEYLKLNDLDNQAKVRKALRTNQFEHVVDYNQAA
jgi:hypothetical protein